MKTKTKGLVAAAAGAALLAGSASTFALWFDTAALGAAGDTVATGRLALGDDVGGAWTWLRRSDNGLENLGNSIAANTEIVPGDAVQYVWDAEDIAIILSGDTLIANLYLDGVGYINPANIAPLTLTISGDDWEIGPVSQIGNYGGVGGFLLIPGLRAATAPDAFPLPNIVLDFPQDPTVHNDPYGLGHLPFSALGGYGRDRSDVLAGVFTPAALQLRLQQVPLSQIENPVTPDAVASAQQALFGMNNDFRQSINAYRTTSELPTGVFANFVSYTYNRVSAWFAVASPSDVAAWLAGGN